MPGVGVGVDPALFYLRVARQSPHSSVGLEVEAALAQLKGSQGTLEIRTNSTVAAGFPALLGPASTA